MRLSADRFLAFPDSPGVPSFRDAGLEQETPPTQRLTRIRRKSDLDLIQNPWTAI
jgi:hypothetical protein